MSGNEKPVEYKFPRRRPEKVSSWKKLHDAEAVSADDLLNLLSDYLGAGLPIASYMEEIYEKTTLTLEEARELLEILIKKKVVHAYPILVEANGQRVAQAEHTFIPTENGVTVTTSL